MICKCSDENRSNFFASDSLWEEAKEKFCDQMVANFAFTNYGGTLIDKLMIQWYRENYPDNFVWEKTFYNGMNAICASVPGINVEDINDMDLFYEGPCIEDLFYKLEEEEIAAETSRIIEEEPLLFIFREEINDWLCANSSLYSFGLDYSPNELGEFIASIKKRLVTAEK